MNIHGAKAGSDNQHKPIIAPDSAQSKTFISIMYGLGEGEIAGLANGYKSVYLDDTPLQNDNGEFNFPNVKVDFRTGTNDQEYIDGFPDVASEVSVGVELKHGTPFIKAFNNLDLDAVRIHLKWGALRSQNAENGDVSGVKIDYTIDLKTDNGGWVQVLSPSINAKTSDAYERSHRIDLPPATTGWQVRVRRLTPNSTSDLVSDRMFVSAITEVIDLKLRYPNIALLGLRYDATSFSNVAKMSARCKGLIIKVPTNYDPVTRTYTGLWNGEFKLAYSNNPAWVYYDLCTNTRYGLGNRLTPAMIDKWSLYRLAQYCDEMVDDGMGGQEPRFTVNVYIQSADGAFELLSKLAGVFRAISYWDGNSIVVDADIPQDSIYSFSRANVIDGIFEYTGTRARDRRTVAKVAWDNPANHFKTEYEYVRDEAAIAKFGVRVADISAWGCTSKGQAQRAGLWALKSEQLETRMVTFKVGLDGYIPSPAKVIEISDELFAGRATGGRVLAINKAKTTITLDRPITAKAGDTLVINGDDGTSQRRQIRSATADKITVTKAFGDISVENVWVLDSQDLATMKFRVLSVTADDNHTFTITAAQYNPVKYDAIDHGAYIDERPISVINPTVQAPTKSVNLSSYHTVNQGVNVTTLVIGWEQVTGAVKYTVEWRKDNGNWQSLPPTGTNSIEIAGVYAGQYEARVTAISAFGQASLATTSQLTTIKGKTGKPPKLYLFKARGGLFSMHFDWIFNHGSEDTNYTEIQVSPDGQANIATLAVFSYPTNSHTITGLQGGLTQFYRARIVDKLGNVSDWTEWVSGTTSADATKVLELISGQISESHLDQALREPIAKIDGFDDKFADFDGKFNGIDGKINLFNAKIPSIEQAVQQANARLPQLNRSIDELMRDKTAKSQEIANIRQKVGDTTTQIRDVVASTDNLTRRFSEMTVSQQRNQDTLNARMQTVQDSIVGAEQAINQMRETMNAKFASLSDNLLVGGDETKVSTDWDITYPIKEQLSAGQKVQITLKNAQNLTSVAVYNSSASGSAKIGDLRKVGDEWVGEFAWVAYGANNELRLYRQPRYSRQSVQATLAKSNDNTAAIDEVKRTIAEKERSLSERIGQIDTAYKQADREANASIQQLERSLSTKERSLSERISQLDADYKQADRQANAKIGQVEQALSTKEQALSERISQLSTQIRQPNSSYASAAALDEVKSNVQRINGRLTAEASKINTLQSTVNGQTTSIRNVEQSVNGVRTIKAVTVDNNGFISGYGLMSELQNGRVTSRFGINADQIYFGATTDAKKPFIFNTRPTTIDGVSYPAGAWFNTAHIARASITNAHIADASIDNAKIANASIDSVKIRNGSVGSLQLQDGSVTSAKIGHLAVDTLNIANGAVIVPRAASFNTERLINDNDVTTLFSLTVNPQLSPILINAHVEAHGSMSYGRAREGGDYGSFHLLIKSINKRTGETKTVFKKDEQWKVSSIFRSNGRDPDFEFGINDTKSFMLFNSVFFEQSNDDIEFVMTVESRNSRMVTSKISSASISLLVIKR